MLKRTLLAAATLLVLAGPVAAQNQAPWVSGADPSQMVDELYALIEKGQSEDLAKRRYLRELRQLAQRYDWPWTRLILSEEFADGNFTQNPVWTVRSGTFQMHQQYGLLTRQDVPRQQQSSNNAPGQPQGSLGEALLGTVLQQMLPPPQGNQQNQQPAATRSDIYTPLDMSNAFDMRVILRTRNEPGRVEFGPYVAGQNDQGYRLVYIPGGNPSFALMRYSDVGSGVVQATSGPFELKSDSYHYVQWLRYQDGSMVIFVNGQEVLQAQDNAFQNGFNGLILSNLGGTHAFREITLYGSK